MAKAQQKPFKIVPLPGDSSKQAAKPYDTRGLLKSRGKKRIVLRVLAQKK